MACVDYVCKPETPYMLERNFYHVQEIAVDKSFRRKGVARELFEFMKVDIRELGKKLPYDENVWTYEQSQDERYRFWLGRKNEKAKKILLCCGVNPSTASPNDLDPTMRRVQAFAEQMGYDGYMMINLYPIRATDPNDMPDQIDERAAEANLHYLEGWLKEAEGFCTA